MLDASVAQGRLQPLNLGLDLDYSVPPFIVMAEVQFVLENQNAVVNPGL